MIRGIALMIAMLIALCGAAFAGEKDTTGLLATIDGVDVPIDDALDEYEYYEMLYTVYGMADQLPEIKRQIAEYYVKLELIYREYDRLGFVPDMEAIEASAKADYEESIQGYTAYISHTDKTEEELLKAAEEKLIADGFDLSYFERYALNSAKMEAVLNHYASHITVTAQDVEDYYNDLVASDRETYTASFALYEQASSSGTRILYVPEGIRTVRHILVLLSEEDQDTMYDLESQMSAVELKLAAANADAETLGKEKEALQAQIDEIFATIDSRAQEIMDKLMKGEDFEALLEQYGEDPGMQSEPYKTEGYQVHADSSQWVTAFRDGAMALQKPGDISQPIRTSYGLHIIRYEGDVEAGAVEYETVRDELETELEEVLINRSYDDQINQWYEASEIVIYMENFDVQTEE